MSEQKFRKESDLLGELNVPADALYGVQTQRGINNYHISRKTMSMYPDFIKAIAYVKLAAVQTNHTLGVINDEIAGAISQALRSWAMRRETISIACLMITVTAVRVPTMSIPQPSVWLSST